MTNPSGTNNRTVRVDWKDMANNEPTNEMVEFFARSKPDANFGIRITGHRGLIFVTRDVLLPLLRDEVPGLQVTGIIPNPSKDSPYSAGEPDVDPDVLGELCTSLSAVRNCMERPQVPVS